MTDSQFVYPGIPPAPVIKAMQQIHCVKHYLMGENKANGPDGHGFIWTLLLSHVFLYLLCSAWQLSSRAAEPPVQLSQPP